MAHRSRLAAVAIGAFALVARTGTDAIATNKCAGAKIKAAGKKAACLLSLEAKEASKSDPIDPLKIAKCTGKFSSAFAKAEAKPPCTTTGDEAGVEDKVDMFVADVDAELATGTLPNGCQGAKIKAAGKKAKCLLGLEAKQAAKGGPIDPLKIAKCVGKFSSAFAKAELKPPCNTTGDVDDIQDKVDMFVADVDSEIPGDLPTTTTSLVVGTTTTTTLPGVACCGSLPSLLSFTTASSGCGTNPPGQVTPARCVQGTNTGVACTDDAICTGGGVCRGHLDCSGLYFGGGQPAGIFLPGTVPDNELFYSTIASCAGDTMNLAPTNAADVPGPGCSTPAGTPTYGQRHCTSPGCLFGAPLALPNALNTATGTCVINVVASRPGVGTGTVSASTGVTSSLNLPLDSQVYLTGAIEPVRVCSTCVGGTTGSCASGTCMGGPRDGLACTPETSALNGSYPTSHDCPPPNAPGGQLGTCGNPASGTFLGCLAIDFNLSTSTQSKSSFATGAQARVFCGYCFDQNITLAFANPPDPCTSDAECIARGDDFDSCRQHSNGAFRNNFATTVSETGTPAGNLSDGLPHASTLVSVFCIPPSYDPIVDPTGELPGPGAVSLAGSAQCIP